MKCQLSSSEINHLRRLLGWVACEIGQSPDELVSTVREIGPALTGVGDYGKRRLVESYDKAANVPQYVRSAVKSLRKAIAQHEGEIVDADFATPSRKASALLPEQ